ncbi:hypothetical protein [Streptomyces sp. AS02]|uniref:hypothetical protein n=1 Tax=Streptomyces sp. AS02 TaxID=2938946 RepID=UPI0020224328|nr:hypothetical protein [Streptomyces sp. AS02]MCL8011707.1 hypothetical protein [Streptomyces sp. AS02]
MRKIPSVLAALGVAALGVVIPAGTAQAAAGCSGAWDGANDGEMKAYRYSYCDTHLGTTESYDSDWGNSSGPFQGTDENAATSLLHKGTSGYAIAFYRLPGYDGGHICLTKGEKWASTLVDGADSYANDRFTNGDPADNRISSHQWVSQSSCGKFMH